MAPSRDRETPVGKAPVVIASVLLLGVIVLGLGFFSGSRAGLYIGILITLAGVLTGVQWIIANGKAGRAR